ncbi:unnamed protein product, partial [Thlaspi arvense]
TKVLVKLLVDGIKRGWRDFCGLITKLTVENKILPVLIERLGCQKTYTQYQNRIKYLKVQYQSYLDLQLNNSGFGWDSETKKCTAFEEVYMRYDSHNMFEDLQTVFDGATANGSKSVGLGDTTDAPTCRVGDDQVKETLVFCESGDDGNDASPILDKNLKGHVEKFSPRKRFRTEACNNLKELKSDTMILWSQSLVSYNKEKKDNKRKLSKEKLRKRKTLSIFVMFILKNAREEEAIQIEDGESDLDIMLLMLENIARATVKDANRIERPHRRPITNIGYAYIQRTLKEEPEHFRSLYRMYPTFFEKLCDLIRTKTALQDTRNICVEEMVATFLLTIGQSSKYCYTIDTFKRSVFATSKNFHKVLKALNTLVPDLMARPGVRTYAKLRESTIFYPYF